MKYYNFSERLYGIILIIIMSGCNSNAQHRPENQVYSSIAQREIKQSVPEVDAILHTPSTAMPPGHKIIRELLGTDIGQMQLDSQAASNFRTFITNSLLITSSSSSNNGYGNSDYNSGSGRIQFCADGSFTETLSSHLSIDTEGMSATSYGTNVMPGYWEVAALPNGMFIILMYSTHPRMLEDSPNGFLPFPVARYGEDFVAMPNNAGLYRRVNNICK